MFMNLKPKILSVRLSHHQTIHLLCKHEWMLNILHISNYKEKEKSLKELSQKYANKGRRSRKVKVNIQSLIQPYSEV